MGTLISKAFVDPSQLPDDAGGFCQVVFLGAAYAYILFYGSGLINRGSELLLLIPSMSRLVGSVVNPVLSGVPDATLVLFSGLGSDPKTQLGIGMGSLAGSNVFLLTVPWAVAIITGRVRLSEDGTPQYLPPDGWPSGRPFRKLDSSLHFLQTGVRCSRSVRNATILMVITTISYLFLLIPAASNGCFVTSQDCSVDGWSTLVGGVFAATLFVAYLVFQVALSPSDSMNDEKVDQLRREAIREHLITIRGLFPHRFVDAAGIVPVVPESRRFQRCLLPFFREFDVNHTGYMDRCDFSLLLSQIGERPSPEQLDILMRAVDLDNKGRVSFMDFARCVAQIINDPKYLLRTGRVSFVSTRSSEVSGLRRRSFTGRLRTPVSGPSSTLSRGQHAARVAALAKFRASQAASRAGDDAEMEHAADEAEYGVSIPDSPRDLSPERSKSLNEPFGCTSENVSSVVGENGEQLRGLIHVTADEEEEHIIEQEHIEQTQRLTSPLATTFVFDEASFNAPATPFKPPQTDIGVEQQAEHDAHLRFVLSSGLTTPTTSSDEKSVFSVDPPLESEVDDDGEEDASLPESIAHLTPDQQQRRIVRMAVFQVVVGLVFVFVVSDAIVQIFNDLGRRIGIEPFYVSFTLSPFLSNASVLIASYTYGVRKTEKSVSVAFASLVGSVCVNNTLSIAVFGMLLYTQGLPWTYASETLVVLIVEISVCVFCVLFSVHRAWHGTVFACIFPSCLGLVLAFKEAGAN